MSMMSMCEVMHGIDSETFRRGAELYDHTFAGCPPQRKQIIEQVMRFFGAASDAYAASLQESISERMKSFLPGGHAERALCIYRNVKDLMVTAGLPDDISAINAAIEKTRQWLEDLGWILIPQDLPGMEGYTTTAGAVKDMIEYEREAIRTRAGMAAEIEAKRKK